MRFSPILIIIKNENLFADVHEKKKSQWKRYTYCGIITITIDFVYTYKAIDVSSVVP